MLEWFVTYQKPKNEIIYLKICQHSSNCKWVNIEWNHLRAILKNIFESESHSVVSDSLPPHGLYSDSEVAQSCLTLCDPMDSSQPGSSIHEIFQARILEWGAISFSRGSSWPRDRTWVSCIVGRHFTIWATREPKRKVMPKNAQTTANCSNLTH